MIEVKIYFIISFLIVLVGVVDIIKTEGWHSGLLLAFATFPLSWILFVLIYCLELYFARAFKKNDVGIILKSSCV